jgi:hypothetical protein
LKFQFFAFQNFGVLDSVVCQCFSVSAFGLWSAVNINGTVRLVFCGKFRKTATGGSLPLGNGEILK